MADSFVKALGDLGYVEGKNLAMEWRTVMADWSACRSWRMKLSIIRAETAFRPPAPKELTPEQAAEWREVVARMPADWFSRENAGLQYCRHVVAARRVAQLVRQQEASDEFIIEDYDRLLKMQERESRACASLAVKMRLTQSTRLRAETAATAIAREPPGRRPWDV